MLINTKDEMSAAAYARFVRTMAKLNVKYRHLFTSLDPTQSITQTDANVELVTETKNSPQPVRNRRRRRHNMCAEESAASI